jgi:hypothetical protein
MANADFEKSAYVINPNCNHESHSLTLNGAIKMLIIQVSTIAAIVTILGQAILQLNTPHASIKSFNTHQSSLVKARSMN